MYNPGGVVVTRLTTFLIGFAMALGMFMGLNSCIDVPEPKVTLTITVPDYIKECLANGYTEEQCLGMLCTEHFPEQFEEKP